MFVTRFSSFVSLEYGGLHLIPEVAPCLNPLQVIHKKIHGIPTACDLKAQLRPGRNCNGFVLGIRLLPFPPEADVSAGRAVFECAEILRTMG